MSGRNNSNSLIVNIISRVIAVLVVALMNACWAVVWFNPPDNGNIVAVAFFGDDGVFRHYECQNSTGYYGCQGSSSDDPVYYDVPDQYELIDSYGHSRTDSKRFLVLNKQSGQYFLADFSTSSSSFKIEETLDLPAYCDQVVGFAERDKHNYWLACLQGGQYYVYHLKEDEVEIKETFSLPRKTRFIALAMFTDDNAPKKICLVGKEKPGDCPKSISTLDYVTTYAAASWQYRPVLSIFGIVLLVLDSVIIFLLLRKTMCKTLRVILGRN